MTTAPHLAALTELLAQDAAAGRLHTRHLQLLALVCTAPRVNISSAGEALGLSYSQTSRVAKRLAADHLIKRAAAKHDERITLLTPTAKGLALDARVRAHVRACQPTRQARTTAPLPHTEDTPA